MKRLLNLQGPSGPRTLVLGMALGLLLLGGPGDAAFAQAAPVSQEKLDPGKDILTPSYVPTDRTARYGYLELEYPKAWKEDARGAVKTKPPVQDDSQSVPDSVRDWVAGALPYLERNPTDKKALGEIARVLGDFHLYTRIVPVMDRYLAVGGTPRFPEVNAYAGGLARLGRYLEACEQYDVAVKKWGSQSEGTSGAVFGARFRYSWLVDRNLRDMVEAFDRGSLTLLFPEDANTFQDVLCDLLTQAAVRQELGWFVPRMEKCWVWLNERHARDAMATISKGGLEVPAALVIAADPLYKGEKVPPEALARRAVETLSRGDSATATKQSGQAVRFAKELSPQRLYGALIIHTRILRQQDELELAFESTAEAEQVAKRINGKAELGWVLVMKGYLLEKLADYRRAADSHAQAMKIGVDLEYSELKFTAKNAMARSLSHTGMAAEVEPYLREIAENAVKSRLLSSLAADFSNWGECLLQMGDEDAALAAFRQALTPVKAAGQDFKMEMTVRFKCLRGTGSALFAQKKYADAEKAYDEYAALAGEALQASSSWVWQLGKAKCRRALGDAPGAQKLIEGCLTAIEQERASLKDFQRRRTLNENKYEAYEVALGLALDRGDTEGAFRIAERSRARSFLDEMGTRSDGAQAPSPRGLEDVAKECPDLCLVVYYQLEDRLLVWTISDGKGELTSLPLAPKATQAVVENFLFSIYFQGSHLKDKIVGGSTRWEAIQASNKAYQALWFPLEAKLPKGKRICIVPHRSLHYVPFQALHDEKAFLIESRDLFYAPSASALIELRHRKPGGSGYAFVIDPILSDDPKSPFSKTESQGLRSQYPDGKFVVKGAATLSAFKDLSKGAGMIHVSSHGYYNPWIPLDSGLVFAGAGGEQHEILKAKDIYAMRFEKPSLIVMSACVSSVGDFTNGDEVTGLTRAFQVAGIQDVIGSLWPVDNEATTQLMTQFHKYLGELRDPVSALRQAELDLIKAKLPIVKWAAFNLTGVGLGPANDKK